MIKAFPIIKLNSQGHSVVTDLGMDLRDFFASMAMQAYFSDSDVSWDKNDLERGSMRAYLLADAMMKAREQ